MASFASPASAAAAAPSCGAGGAGDGEDALRGARVGAGASRGEIKAAYRRLAREVHPDAGDRGDEGFIQLHAAYATLADPDECARYDRSVARPAPVRRAAAAPSAFRPRRWETDQCW